MNDWEVEVNKMESMMTKEINLIAEGILTKMDKITNKNIKLMKQHQDVEEELAKGDYQQSLVDAEIRRLKRELENATNEPQQTDLTSKMASKNAS